ncbi:MAG: DNA primase [Candidatus Komeilibacteria bacterium]
MTTAEEVKSRLDIVDIVKEYIPLKQTGSNWRANCPFHQEKTPSFMVSKEKQIWHCFGCNQGGDVISFVQQYEGLEFPEALKLLADRAGVVITTTPGQGPSAGEKSLLWQLNELAGSHWQEALWSATPAAKKTREYLFGRGLQEATIKQWGLGLSSEAWDDLYQFLRQAGQRDQELIHSGLIQQKDGRMFDRFRSRLMFPIRDVQGKICGFTARTLAGIVFAQEDFGGKYINSPQTAVYNKSAILYGLDLAKAAVKQADYIIVVEGNMDAIMSHQAGVKNVVAVSGTALTGDQLRLIKRFTHNIVLAFDADAAGSQALYKSGVVSAADFDMNVKAAMITGAKDPADIIQHNPDDWKQLLRQSIPIVDFYYQEILKRVDLSRADHKKMAIDKMLSILAALKSKVEQDHYVKKLGSDLGISENILWEQLRSVAQRQSNDSRPAEPVKQITHDDVLAETLLAIIAARPLSLGAVIDRIEPEVLNEVWQPLYKKIIIYYTKNQSGDLQGLTATLEPSESPTWSRIVYRADASYLDWADKALESELESIIKRLKVRHLKERMRTLSDSIARAERTGDRLEVERLTIEFNDLSQKLASYHI